MEENHRPRQIVVGQKVTEGKIDLSKKMRREMTPGEATLWQCLRRNQLAGLSFRRQPIIAGFIADFYCHRAALAVEVDGSHHEAEYDSNRDKVFGQHGIRVLRFTNDEVLTNMDAVLEKITQAVTPPPSPLPEAERGGIYLEVAASGEPHGRSDTTIARTPPPRSGEGAGGRGNSAQWDAAHVMTTYARQPVEFIRGSGVYLYNAEGREYIDFLAGIAVCSVGHAHPYLTQAIQEQAATLLHVSNLYLTENQARLARRLVELSDFERVFFCNSGAEANEAALKLARKFGRTTGGDAKTNVVTALNSFHGRTIATVTATGQPKYSKDFAPLPAGFSYVPFNDIDALKASVDENTCAILLEPIQGEGGVHSATTEYLQVARDLADQYDALLIFDEVQTGMGRTGRLWAYQQYGIIPDVLTSAKGLGGGVPIGACLARGRAADVFKPGDHGSTFAGNPLSTAAANAVLDIIADENLLENARAVSEYFRGLMADLRDKHPDLVGEARGMGLMLGLELKKPIARKVVAHALKHGLVANATGDTTLRFLPPLTITESEASKGMERLEAALVDAANEV